jgi:hypothetical protein
MKQLGPLPATPRALATYLNVHNVANLPTGCGWELQPRREDNGLRRPAEQARSRMGCDCRATSGHQAAMATSLRRHVTELFTIVYMNCKWDFARRQWYYENTHITQNIRRHSNKTQHANLHKQNGHITHDECNTKIILTLSRNTPATALAELRTNWSAA